MLSYSSMQHNHYIQGDIMKKITLLFLILETTCCAMEQQEKVGSALNIPELAHMNEGEDCKLEEQCRLAMIVDAFEALISPDRPPMPIRNKEGSLDSFIKELASPDSSPTTVYDDKGRLDSLMYEAKKMEGKEWESCPYAIYWMRILGDEEKIALVQDIRPAGASRLHHLRCRGKLFNLLHPNPKYGWVLAFDNRDGRVVRVGYSRKNGRLAEITFDTRFYIKDVIAFRERYCKRYPNPKVRQALQQLDDLLLKK